jgi:hypothetical protein
MPKVPVFATTNIDIYIGGLDKIVTVVRAGDYTPLQVSKWPLHFTVSLLTSEELESN